MPYVCVECAAEVSEAKMDLLQKEIGRLISIIPGKTIDNCMTQIRGGGNLFMSGKSANAAFCQVRMYGESPKECKVQFSDGIKELLKNELGIETVYVNFVESLEWGR